MNSWQNIHDSDTVFTLVTKRLTTGKIHELLEKIQEFLAHLEEKDLSEDLFKQITVKKNFQDGSNPTVYLNYCLPSTKSAQVRSDLPDLTSKRFLNEMTQRDEDTFPHFSLPIKKVKGNRSLKSLAQLPSSFSSQQDNLRQQNCSSNSFNNFFPEYLMDDANSLTNQIFEKEYLRHQTEELSKMNNSINFSFNGEEQNKKPDKISVENNVIEIEDFSEDEQINNNSTQFSSPIFQKFNYNSAKLRIPHNSQISCSSLEDKRHSSRFAQSTNDHKFHQNYFQNSEQKSTHISTFKKSHHYLHRTSHYKRSSSNARMDDFSNGKPLRRFKSVAKISAQHLRAIEDNIDPPLHLMDAKEDEFVYQQLRKPFTYLKPIQKAQETPSFPIHIEID